MVAFLTSALAPMPLYPEYPEIGNPLGVAALAYGLLTLLLGGGYAAVVLGLGQLLGRDSSLVVAAATLAVAAVFQPARRRIQQTVALVAPASPLHNRSWTRHGR